MMNKLWTVCIVALAVSTCVESINLTRDKLVCKSTDQWDIAELDINLKHPCRQVKTAAESGTPPSFGMKLVPRLAMVESCLCNLVPHQTFWDSFMTREAYIMYDNIVRIISAQHKGAAKEDELHFFRDILDFEKQKPNQLWLNFIDTFRNKNGAKSFLNRFCDNLDKTFNYFWSYVTAAGQLVNNPDLAAIVTTYDNNLFRLVVAQQGCQYMLKSVKAEL